MTDNTAPYGGPTNSTTPELPRQVRIGHLQDWKTSGHKWTMLTAYDVLTANIFDQAGVPALLVGDSSANTVLGHKTTLAITENELITMCKAVVAGAQRALVIADLPFGSYQISPEQGLQTAIRFMKETGAHAVKLEGGTHMAPTIHKIVTAGIPVFAHVGFTPQAEHALGGYKVQGRADAAQQVIDDAHAVQEAGAHAVILEMVPTPVATTITAELTIPTVGIGAGAQCDAQVLVWQDMFGLSNRTPPRFVKQYANLRDTMITATTTFINDVATSQFPASEHQFDH